MKAGKSLQDIAVELDRRSKSKRDFVAHSRSLSVEASSGEFRMVISGQGDFGIRETAHEQVAGRLGIPKSYYDRMRSEAPYLLAHNVNHWLASGGEQRMVRTLDGQARALLSNRYRPLDDDQLAEAVLPALANAGCSVESAEVTDRRMYIKAVSPRLTFEVRKGDIVQAGLVISNSEVGMGGVRVEPLVYRLACLNGMIVQDHSLRKYHVGRGFGGDDEGAQELYRDETREADDKAFFLKVRDTVVGSLQRDVFERVARSLTQAASDNISGDPVKVVEAAQKRLGLNEQERGGVLSHLIRGGDLTRYGLLNAVTRYSQDAADYDRATDLERLGGVVLELPQRDWKAIAEAK